MPALSSRVTGLEDAMSIRFNTMVYEMKRAGRDVITMSLGEAFFDLELKPMDRLPHHAIFHYSHSRGLPELRQRLSEYFLADYGLKVDPEREILITAGSKAAIYFTFMSILERGSEVLVQEPFWVSYPEQIRLCDARAVAVPWAATVEDYERYVTEKTRAIVLCHPNNPRGHVYSRRELDVLFRLAEKHDLWLLSDEAYSEFVLDAGFVSTGTLDPSKSRVVVFNSISKNHGISGWRLGYLIGNAGLIDQVLKVNQHVVTCPATILSYYVAAYYDDILRTTRPQIRAVVELRKQARTLVEELGLEALPGEGTFYLFLSTRPSTLGSVDFCTRLLQEQGVSAVPGIGYGPGCEQFIRVSVGTEPIERIREGLVAIKRLIDATR